MDARSLHPVLSGETDRHRDVVTAGLNDWRMGYDGRYKLVTGWAGEDVLYDLVEDPWEDVNIARANPGIVERLTAAIEGARH
jgi:hypothetical protein